MIVALSGRNRLRGFVEEVRVDGLLAQVRLRIGDQMLTAVITGGIGCLVTTGWISATTPALRHYTRDSATAHHEATKDAKAAEHAS